MSRTLLLILCLGLAGCGQIPQPFRHDGTIDGIARPNMTRGVTVRPVESLPDGALLAQSVVKALEQHEIPAAMRTGPALGATLEGRPARQDGANGLEWVMQDIDGTVRTIGFVSLPPGAFRGAEPEALRRHGAALAKKLAASLTGADAQAVAHEADARSKRKRIRLAPMAGLPGDGDTALPAALSRALDLAGMVPVSSDPDYVLEGHVTIIPGRPGEEIVAVSWVLKNADGSDLGTINQEGAVPAGRLQSPWGGLARDIAQGGAVGVSEALAAIK